jgi:hypothetical protein
VPSFEIVKSFFFGALFFPESGLIFLKENTQNSTKIMLWRINLSVQKYTFCKIGQKFWIKVEFVPEFTLGALP